MITPKAPKISDSAAKLAYKLTTERNHGICELCHHQPGNRHHRQGRNSFNTTPSNLLLACGSGTTGCHGLIHSNPQWARERGYIVSDWATPTTYPVIYWVRTGLFWRETWVLLDDHGGMQTIPDTEANRRINEGHMYDEGNN